MNTSYQSKFLFSIIMVLGILLTVKGLAGSVGDAYGDEPVEGIPTSLLLREHQKDDSEDLSVMNADVDEQDVPSTVDIVEEPPTLEFSNRSSFTVEPTESSFIIDVLDVQAMDIKEVLKLIMIKTGLNIAVGEDVSGRVSIYLKEVDVLDVLRIVLDMNNLAYVYEEGIYRIITDEAYEELFGYPFGLKIQTKVVPLLHINGEGLLPVLEQMKSSAGKVIFSEQTRTLILIDEADVVDVMHTLIRNMDVPVQNKTYSLLHSRAADIAVLLEGVVTPNVGRLEVDAEANTITVTDRVNKIEEISALMKKFDRIKKDIRVQAKIIQIALDDEYPTGVDWDGIISDYQTLPFDDGESMNGHRQLSMGTVIEEDFVVLQEALGTVGANNIISEEDIIMDEGNQFRIPVRSLPSSVTAEEIVDHSFNVAGQIADFVVNIQQNDVDKVTADIRINIKDDLLASNDAQGIAFELDPGETIVIGGLFRPVTVETLKKFPLLGDIPLIGIAFSRQKERVRRTEMVVFITPYLVDKQ